MSTAVGAAVTWRRGMRWLWRLLALGVLLGVAAIAVLYHRGTAPAGADSVAAALPAGMRLAASADPVARGAYLARAGNCAGCHTARGGAAYAGGRAIATPFGAVVASNLTPDARTGLGAWTADDFWRAMHEGRSREGRLLVPAFPYAAFTRLTREDSDALWAFLRSQPPVETSTPRAALRFPFGTPLALALWRGLYFQPARFEPDPARDDAWNRGRYLVDVLGHCGACHGARTRWGGPDPSRPADGAELPGEDWFAPSLQSPEGAGVAQWSEDEIAALLASGRTARASALGPMAEVVFRSTQFLTPEDLRAMARVLRDLPQHQRPQTQPPVTAAAARVMAAGADLYRTHCADCHGNDGEGRPGRTAPLAGNRVVRMTPATNLIAAIRHGGFLPVTAGNPRPYGMPPHAGILDDAQIAAVATYLRQSWGHAASEVSLLDVMGGR